MRERIDTSEQCAYWNAISDDYQHITRIRCEDFHYGPQIPGESLLQLLPEFVEGDTALELGCGAAQNSMWLAERGVKCLAIDISETQLSYARVLAAERRMPIRLLRGELEAFRPLVGEERFDFVHSSHALEFVNDPASVVKEMAACLKPGGTLMISTVHPLFNGEWISGALEGEFSDTALMADGLFLTNYFAPPDDVRDEPEGYAVSRAYPISDWFRWLRAAGLNVVALEEPAAIADAPYSSDDWADHDGQLDAIPSTVIFVAVLRSVD